MTEDRLNTQPVVVGLFASAGDAKRALHVLHQDHFAPEEVTAAFREPVGSGYDVEESPARVGSNDRWFGQLRQLYRGDEHHPQGLEFPLETGPTRFQAVLQQLDLPRTNAADIDHDLARAAAMVVVRSQRVQDAGALLHQAGARIVYGDERGIHAASQPAPVVHSTPYTADKPLEPGHIQLFGEVLRVRKETVSSGDVRVRKEAVTEMETVQVPVTREHLVVERSHGGGQGGAEDAIRIPLSEERVHIDKETVLREEYKVGKREVNQKETMSDTIRREHLLVEEPKARSTD